MLSCRRKDDIPTQLPETVIDDIMTDVNVLKIQDGRVEACLIMESTRIASWIQVRKEVLENTRTQQYIDSNLVSVQIGVPSKRKGQDGKDRRNESSEKVINDERRERYRCREAGHAKSQSRTRLKGSGRCRRETRDIKLPSE